MKKTIQINIAGIVFHIEEDAYETLKNYLESIKGYFSGYEGSEEIVADIEARIAEKFIGKNKPDALPVITAAEVSSLMQSMGSVADFEAIEEETAFVEEEAPKASSASKEESTSNGPRRLYRDNQRKALAGVLAGLAHYFKVDVVWFRVIFLIGVLGLAESGIAGFLILAYIICWIAFPSNDNLTENKGIKKFYRDPERKVVGGVASGLATYLNVDVAVLRVIFVVMVAFFGTGLIAYLIMWIASPMARSLTQKMEMKGEAVTIENIDSNIKQNLNVQAQPAGRSESAIATVLLLPFRIIGKIFQALGKGLGHLGPVLRVLLGIILVLLGLGLTVGAITGTAVFFGLLSDHHWFTVDHNLGFFAKDLPSTAGIFLFLAIGLPAIATLLSGIILISNDRIGNRNFWLTGLGLWILGLGGLSVIGGRYSMNFAKRGTVVESSPYTLSGNILYLDSFRNLEDDTYDYHTRVVLEEGEQLEVVKEFTSSGPSREAAREHAKGLSYEVHQKDSVLVFDERAELSEGSSFRDQRVSVKLKIPAGTRVKMSNRFADHLLANSWSVRSKYGLDYDDFDKLVFEVNDDNELICLDCEPLSEEEQQAVGSRDSRYSAYYMDDEDFKPRGDYDRRFDLHDFNSLEVGGIFRVMVTQGDSYSVEFVAEREDDIEDLNVYVRNGELHMGFRDRFFRDRERVNAFITMPTLEGLEISGASKLKVINFKDIAHLNLDISGASNAQVDVEAGDMDIDASGASKLNLMGRISELNIDISGASKIDASRAEVSDARVDASGASHVEFDEVGSLRSDTSGASSVKRK